MIGHRTGIARHHAADTGQHRQQDATRRLLLSQERHACTSLAASDFCPPSGEETISPRRRLLYPMNSRRRHPRDFCRAVHHNDRRTMRRECILRDAFICDYVRTPIGRYAGALSASAPTISPPIRSGCCGAQQRRRLGSARRMRARLREPGRRGQPQRRADGPLLAGLPETVPAHTINRLCGSGLDAVGAAARAVRADEAELILAGGVESMSRAPLVMAKATEAFSRGGNRRHDHRLALRQPEDEGRSTVSIPCRRRPRTSPRRTPSHAPTRTPSPCVPSSALPRIERGFFAADIAPIEAPGRAGATGSIATSTLDRHHARRSRQAEDAVPPARHRDRGQLLGCE